MPSPPQRPLITLKGAGGRSPVPKLRLAGLAVALVLVGAVLAWFWTSGGGPRAGSAPGSPPAGATARGAVPPPIYEEQPHGLPPAGALSRLDERIFAALNQAGIQGGQVRVKVEAGHPVELTRVLVTLGQGQVPGALADKVAPLLAGDQVQVARQATSQGLDLELSLAGLLTHRLSLLSTTSPSPRPARPALPSRTPAALVIDDLGYRMGPVKRLLALDLPLTLSILPHSPFGRKITALAGKKGLEVLLHLPMEPRSYPRLDPGPGALLSNMDRAQLQALTRSNLDSLPEAKGANNHMGSRLTEDPAAMEAVMEVLAERGLFFLDSQTSAKSVALQAARRAGVPSARRQVFLDNDPSPKAVRAQMERVLSLARRGVSVIAIGHPNAGTLTVLEEYAPRLKKELGLTAVAGLTEHWAGTQGQAKAGRPANPLPKE